MHSAAKVAKVAKVTESYSNKAVIESALISIH
jgi:hypothetical protein